MHPYLWPSPLAVSVRLPVSHHLIYSFSLFKLGLGSRPSHHPQFGKRSPALSFKPPSSLLTPPSPLSLPPPPPSSSPSLLLPLPPPPSPSLHPQQFYSNISAGLISLEDYVQRLDSDINETQVVSMISVVLDLLGDTAVSREFSEVQRSLVTGHLLVILNSSCRTYQFLYFLGLCGPSRRPDSCRHLQGTEKSGM